MFPIRDHNPSGRVPVVTYALIVVNVAAFLLTYQLAPSPLALQRLYMTWGLVPARLIEGDGRITVLTSMFLHGGWMHLLGNMLFLWIFGDNMEDEMGHLRYLLFYFAVGLAAAVAQVASDRHSGMPMVGASGAIAGVMGGYLLLFPRARIDVLFIFLIFFRIFAIPAWIVLGVWFTLQLFNGATTPMNAGGVAFWAHIGGFVGGVVLTIPALIKRGGRGHWQSTSGQPPHPPAEYRLTRSSIPRVPRR